MNLLAQWPDPSPPERPAPRAAAVAAAGGGHEADGPAAVRATGLTWRAGPNGLVLRRDAPADRTAEAPEAVWEAIPAALGWPEEWTGARGLRAEVAPGPAGSRLTVEVVARRGRLERSVELAADRSVNLRLSLTELPLAGGLGTEHTVALVRLRWTPRPGSPASAEMRVASLELEEARDRPRPPLVDRFGQRRARRWPGKILRPEDWAHALAREEAWNRAHPPLPGRARHGGRTDGPRGPATGFFHVTRRPDGRWTLVDPEGWPFFSLGVTGVRLGLGRESTPVGRRAALFEELPADTGAEDAADAPCGEPLPESCAGFFRANLRRRLGDLDRWPAQVADRLSRWGLNTLGNWSDPALWGTVGLPYTVPLSTLPADAPRLGLRWPDLRDPRWREAVRRAWEPVLAPRRDDPWMLGVFVDNELPWRGLPEAEAGPYAERYFSAVRELLADLAPHHLYLGCRFTRQPPARAVVAAAGRAASVLTVNCYDHRPDPEAFGRWHEWSERPLLIGEFHFPRADARQVPPPYQAFPPRQRGRAVRDFLRTWTAQPWALGAHWFQYVDQPLTGRPRDGENQLVGLVDITDQPYAELRAAFREAAARPPHPSHLSPSLP